MIPPLRRNKRRCATGRDDRVSKHESYRNKSGTQMEEIYQDTVAGGGLRRGENWCLRTGWDGGPNKSRTILPGGFV